MNEVTAYNDAKLITVVFNPTSIFKFITWKPMKKFLGIIIQKEGFYDEFNDYIGREIDKEDLYTVGTIVYRKPRVTFYYEGNFKHTVYAETDKDALVYFTNSASNLTVYKNSLSYTNGYI